jgi:hypothetical protein
VAAKRIENMPLLFIICLFRWRTIQLRSLMPQKNGGIFFNHRDVNNLISNLKRGCCAGL